MMVPKRYIIAFLAFIGCMNLLSLIKYFKLIYDVTVLRTYGDILAQRIALGFTCVGGVIVTRYGGAICFGIGIAVSVLINLLIITSEIGSRVSLGPLDFLDGLFQALAISAIPDMWSRWAPLQQRSRLTVFTFMGLYFAPAALWIGKQSWFTTRKNFLFAYSIIIIIWCVIWFLIVRNDPSEDEVISHFEKQYLTQHTPSVDRPRRAMRTYPWRSILRSKPVTALCIIGFILYFGVTFVLLYVPNVVTEIERRGKYEQVVRYHILGENEDDNVVWLSMVAYFSVLGFAADFIRQKTNFTSTQIRKLYICVGFAIGVIALFVFWSGIVKHLPFFLIFQLSRCSVEAAIFVNVIDLTPNYSSLVWGIVKTFMTIGDLGVRYLILSSGNQNRTTWDAGFHGMEILYVVGALIYFFLGSSELQKWNTVPIDDQELRKRRNNV